MATIYDVARLAGVSPATVSRVFSGRGVTTAKVQAVREAADRLSFRPSRAARALRKRCAEVIALIIPDIENPYFTELARGVEDGASESGYCVVLCNSDGQTDKERSYLEIASAEQMAGVIIAAASVASDLSPFLDQGRPVVAVDRRTRHDIDTVLMANREAGRLATAPLLDRHHRVAYIGGPDDIETSVRRAEGWRDAHAAAGRSLPVELRRFESFRVEGGRRAMASLLQLPDPPDAVVAGNNLIGVGVLQTLSERGLIPPRIEVAVVGSLPFTTLPPGAVSVVRLPAREMGKRAVQLLLNRLGDDEAPVAEVVLGPESFPSDSMS